MGMRLTTLGACRLEDEEGRIIAAPHLSLIMLAYLYRSRQPVSRRDLGILLWPANREAAATNLRSTLLRLLKVFPAGKSCVVSEGQTLAVDHSQLSCDLDFEYSTSGHKKLEASSDAVAKRFLPSDGIGSTPLDTWIRDVRSHHVALLRQEFLSIEDPNSKEICRALVRRAGILLLEHDPGDDEVRRRISVAQDSPPPANDLPLPATPISPVIQALHHSEPEIDRWAAPRIALLPPDTLAAAQKAGSIANALIEDLTIGLCSTKAVSVVAPYTSERIRASRDKAAVLEKHNITYVLDSQRTEDSLFVQLVFLPTDEVVWAERFRLHPANIMQQRVVITDAVQLSLVDRVSSNRAMALDYCQKPEAYIAYLRGLQNLSSMTLPSMRRARRHFKEALEHDREFASALAGLSRTFSMEWILTARGDSDLLTEAARFADQAVSGNAMSAGAFKELGVSKLFMGRIDESLEALATAEGLSPHYADVLYSHADSLVHASRPQDALAKIQSSIELNPLPPDPYFWAAAGACYFLGEFKQALDYINKMRDTRPADRLAAASWAMLGDMAKARACRLRVLKDNPTFDVERWVEVLPHKDKWQTELYREGLLKAGF